MFDSPNFPTVTSFGNFTHKPPRKGWMDYRKAKECFASFQCGQVQMFKGYFPPAYTIWPGYHSEPMHCPFKDNMDDMFSMDASGIIWRLLLQIITIYTKIVRAAPDVCRRQKWMHGSQLTSNSWHKFLEFHAQVDTNVIAPPPETPNLVIAFASVCLGATPFWNVARSRSAVIPS